MASQGAALPRQGLGFPRGGQLESGRLTRQSLNRGAIAAVGNEAWTCAKNCTTHHCQSGRSRSVVQRFRILPIEIDRFRIPKPRIHQVWLRFFDSPDQMNSEGGAKGITLAVIRFGFLVDHYVAVLEVHPQHLVLGDPAVGRRVVARDEFLKDWKRMGVTIYSISRAR